MMALMVLIVDVQKSFAFSQVENRMLVQKLGSWLQPQDEQMLVVAVAVGVPMSMSSSVVVAPLPQLVVEVKGNAFPCN